MKRTKVTWLFSRFLVFALLLSGCQKNSNEGKKESEKDKIRVALLLSGSRGDGAYLDFVCEGADRAEEELGIDLKVIEISESSDYESNLIAMANDGYDLVIGGSTSFGEFITLHASEYPDVKFAVIDGMAEGENVVSAQFSFADGGYLAGVAAAELALDTSVPGIDGKKAIGYVGGMDVPTLQSIERGFKEGVASVDPEIDVLSAYVGSFNDPVTAKELSMAQFNQGVNVIMCPAGGSGLGIFEAAANENKYVIGFDVYEQGEYEEVYFTTVVRGISERVYDIIESVTDGTFEGGTVVTNTVSNGYVTLSDMDNFKKITGDAFPEYILTDVDKVIEDMKDGTLLIED